MLRDTQISVDIAQNCLIRKLVINPGVELYVVGKNIVLKLQFCMCPSHNESFVRFKIGADVKRKNRS